MTRARRATLMQQWAQEKQMQAHRYAVYEE